MGFSSTSLAQMSLIGQGAGAATSAIGGYFGAASQKSALSAQAGLADTNARVAEMAAQSTLAQGQKEVGRLTLRAGQLKSTQRAGMAANGIDLGVGSAAETLASTDIMKEIDANQLQANAVAAAWGQRIQGVNYQNDALTKRATASSISPFSAAATSLMGSAGKVASSWYALDNAGALATANASSDPIQSLGDSRGWWKY